MERKATIYDIAKKLNITAATVSRALNNNPKISEATRKLVFETAAQLNYNQNKLARALRNGRSYNVGVVVPYINRNFFASVIRGIEDELSPRGYQVIICQTYEDKTKEVEVVNTLVNAQIDGIMMSVSWDTVDTDHFQNVLKKNVPLIFFDRAVELKGISSVTINDFEGGYNVTKHLIEQGCRHIAHITAPQNIEIYRNRFEGYRQALLDNGMEIREEYVLRTKNDIIGGQEAIKKLFKLSCPPDAIYGAGDFIALGAIQQIREMKLRIPEDICVVGFSNEPFTKFMELSISSVDQSPVEMGRMTAQVFLEKVLNANQIQIEKKVVLPPKLLVRMSSSRISTPLK